MTNKVRKRPTKLLCVDADKELHRIFKIYCINEHTTMTDFILSKIERALSNYNPKLSEIDQRHLKAYFNSKR